MSWRLNSVTDRKLSVEEKMCIRRVCEKFWIGERLKVHRSSSVTSVRLGDFRQVFIEDISPGSC